ncbi:MAG TPA: hypothetical protein VNH11_26545 [Pirellulales bacterium]|nr:hypothetical protein [Pirellulales bacterium]
MAPDAGRFGDALEHIKMTLLVGNGVLPRSEEFIREVRRAARIERRPTTITDSELVKANGASRALERAALWLSPKIVERYAPDDFAAWSGDDQHSLRQAVDDFRAVAAAVPSNKPATREQFSRGLDALDQLQRAVQCIVLSDWLESVERLTVQAEQWAREFGWQSRRERKQLEETVLGNYSLPQLQFYAEQHLYVLDPVARFVPGASGAFDLSIQPSYYLTSLYRDFDKVWHIHLDLKHGANGGRVEPWSKGAFKQSVEDLRALL